MIGPLDRQLAQQVRIDLVLWMRIAGPGPLVDRRQANLRHQPPRPAATDIMAYSLQMPGHLAAAIHGQSKKVASITSISASVSSVSGTGA
jgi:hypothetical protein